MKNLLHSSYNGFKAISRSGLSRVSRASSSLYSTQTTQISSSSHPDLYKRISPLGDPSIPISPVLEKWVEEGNAVDPSRIRSMIKQLREYRRFTHALEIELFGQLGFDGIRVCVLHNFDFRFLAMNPEMGVEALGFGVLEQTQMLQWMTDRNYDALLPGDMAIRLDLISKIHGLEEAEKYFDSIPEQSKGIQTYGALLNCYAHNKSVDKAEALMQKMKELGLAMNALPYNVLLNLFHQVGLHEKLDTLMEEMKEKGIEMDKFTFSIRLSACVATSDIEGLERILKRMEDDSQVTLDWKCCAIAADGYIKAGLIDKALKMLKRSEELVLGKNKRTAYENLLTLYANAGQKDEVYRIWKRYKSSEKKLYNTAYICMISSLSKLGDIPGAEKIIQEWESKKTNYDFKVPNCLIAAYCNNGLLEKAETVMSKEIEKGNKPIPSAWDRLAAAYVKENQIPKAVDAVRKSFQASRLRWKPNLEVVSSCLEYLKQKGEVEAVEEFERLLA
ncbi:hypothetical protein Sjap_025664 [Stephania japonica]|uniref:Pentatricopeptide repeat-containing protein n=1 Tax=Stephania japonica TaxID=461633 RepID=A0AAP0E9W4_9MAGN